MTVGNGSMLEGGLILLAGMALVACVWTVRRQHLRWPGARAKRAERSEAQTEVGRDLQDGLVDLCERIDSSVERLDAKSEVRIARLEELLAAADGRIARLELLREETARAAIDAEACGPADRARDVTVRQVAPGPTCEAAVAAEGPGQVEAEPALAGSPQIRHIYEMASKGVPAIKIAEAVAVPLGEVELVLSLRRFAAERGN